MKAPARQLRCSVCGEPTVIGLVEAKDEEIGFCPNHLPDEAKQVYEELRAAGWDAPAPKPVH